MRNFTGAEIWFGVDATSLQDHERLKNTFFNLIIFNFPHIGGKMKIHRNRLLLKQFFSSSNFLLAEGGSILVTLCRGQSGTCYDSIQRKTCDTWQIITMATYGDLILKKVIPFKAEEWPEYYCNGYRSLEKGFHVSGALTFSFSKAILDLRSLVLGRKYCEFNNAAHCLHQVQYDKIGNQLFDEITCIQKYLNTHQIFLQIIEKILKTCLCKFDEDSYRWWMAILKTKSDCNLNILQVYYKNQNIIPYQTKIFFKLPPSKSVEPLFGFVMKRCKRSTISCHNQLYSVEEYRDIISNLIVISIFRTVNNGSTIVIHLKEFIQTKVNFSTLDLNFPLVFDWPVKSLQPASYTHHLSFWIPKACLFSHKKLAVILQWIAGDFIRDFILIDQFKCPVTHRNSACYQITYQSLSVALSPDKVWHLHLNIIGGVLKDQLGVEIR